MLQSLPGYSLNWQKIVIHIDQYGKKIIVIIFVAIIFSTLIYDKEACTAKQSSDTQSCVNWF